MAFIPPAPVASQFDAQRQKAFEFVQDTTKQVITLSIAILSLTITFAEKLDRMHGDWILNLSWALYVVAIICGIWVLYALSGTLEQIRTNIVLPSGTLAQAGTNVPVSTRGSNATIPALIQLGAFIVATILIVVYAVFAPRKAMAPSEMDKLVSEVRNLTTQISDIVQKLGTSTPPATVETRISLDLSSGGLEIDCDETRYLVSGFEIGKYKGDEKLAERARNVGRMLRKSIEGRQLTALILVGSADKQPLHGSMKAFYDSNAGLAQARAKWVQERLEEGYGDRVRPLIVLSTGPTFIGHNVPKEKLALDRSVIMCAVWSASRPAVKAHR